MRVRENDGTTPRVARNAAPDLLYVARHGSAGERNRFDRNDRFRRLDERGREEADAFARVFVDLQPPAVLTSTFTRCLEMVEPLARMLGLELVGCPELTIGADPRATRELLRRALPQTVMCTHREVIDALLLPAVRCEKAATLVLQRSAGELRMLDYLPPPTRLADPSARSSPPRPGVGHALPTG